MFSFSEKVLIAFLSLLISFAVILLVVYIPMGFRTQASCLAQGYPRSAVTYDLTSYCLTQEGVIAPKVVRQ